LIEDWSYKIKNANPTKSTKNALIIIHGLKPITQYQTKKVMADIGSSLKEFLLAKSIKVAVLNEQSLDISLK